MGQYKVPQNVESEDKILGPLTFKQFVYAIIGVAWAAITFTLFNKFLPLFIIIGLPPAFLFMMLAFYQRDGQDFEKLLIAMTGYFSQSRRRHWRKENIVVSFKVEPRKVEAEQSQRNPAEIRSELDHLASTIDSRGWNHPTGITTMAAQPAVASDRLVVPTTTPPAGTEEAETDVMDLKDSPLAQNLAALLEESAQDMRSDAIGHMTAPKRTTATPSVSVTTPASTDILKLATESDDISISQLAANATRIVPLQEGQTVDMRTNGNTQK